MGSKNKNRRTKDKDATSAAAQVGYGGGLGRKIITDPRFASVHSDPRFQKVPRRESKVAIDARFQRVFTDKRFGSSSAPLDKRGKRRKARSSKDSLRDYYRIEEDDEEKVKKKKEKDSDGESGDESESEKEENVKSGGKSALLTEDSSEDEEDSDEPEGESIEKAESDESTTEEEDYDETDEEHDEVLLEDGKPELVEENIPEIEKETRRLAVVNMDWRNVSALDLYVVLSSFLPKDGQIMSVAVYPSEFGLQRTKEEELHGPVGIFDGEKDNNDEANDEEEEDEGVINQKLRAYEISRLRYFYAVVECDSSATADSLYKACDGVEFERSSNKLDLRFIPDYMEFKHSPRDVATEAPANYEGVDFHSRALQMSKVHLSWDEDEPHRVKTLKRKFKADQLAELELKEFLASDESESDGDENDATEDKKEKKKDKYRALIQSGEDGYDEDEKEDDQDMEVTFNTGLEDLSKRIIEKKDKKSETVWEAYLRKRRENKKARKNKVNKYSSEDDDGYNSDNDREAMEQPDDFFVEEPLAKRKKGGKQRQDTEKEADEASRAELELLLANDKTEDAGVKGYNLKRKKTKGKKGREEVDEGKIPVVAYDDPRFSAVFTSPLFALDPTDPQFKRSATYALQVAQKQKGEQKDWVGINPPKPTTKARFHSNDAGTSKDEHANSNPSAYTLEKHELSAGIRSIKMKIKQIQPHSNRLVKKDKRKQA